MVPEPTDEDPGRMVRSRRCPEHPGARFSWTYSVDVHEPGEARDRRTRGGFATQAEANAALADVVAKLHDGHSVKEPSRETLEEWLNEWQHRRRHVVKASTAKVQGYVLGKHVNATRLGGIQLRNLTPATLHDHLAALMDHGLSPKSVANLAALLRKALNDAVDAEKLIRNPMLKVSLRPSKRPGRDLVTWEPEEITAFLKACEVEQPPALYALMLTLATTGCRRSEALALRWDDIDRKRGELVISRSLDGVNKEGQPVFGTPKSERSIRRSGIPDSVVAVLDDYRAGRIVTPMHNLIFTWPDGRPLRPDWASRAFRRIADRLVPDVRAGARLHDLRHAWVSAAVAAGLTVKEVQEQVGHYSAAFTLDRYAELWQGAKRRAVNKVAVEVLGVG